MAGSTLSDYAANKVIDHVNGKTSFTMPGTVALALCTALPTDASTGATIVEPTAGQWSNYVRKVITPSSDWNAASSRSAATAASLAFVGFSSGTGATVIGFAVCDSSTTGAGNMLYWGTVTSITINTTHTPATVAAGGLVVSISA